ncbi:MAG: hypothetical protein PHQ74_14560 [Crocinitomicaceae bacterium]|nr:hypothetical protein [Crocinitomicaceae bacterium]
MKVEMTREQMIALIASDYGFGPETTNRLNTKVLQDTCNSSTPYLYLRYLLNSGDTKIYIRIKSL